MPSYGAQVTAHEAYDLINYIRHSRRRARDEPPTTPLPAAERDAILRDIAGASCRSSPTRAKRLIWIACMAIGAAVVRAAC